MKRIVLCLAVSLAIIGNAFGQNVFNPSDPIIRYDANQPLGSPQHPNPAIPGLQKWVSVPTIGVSTGSNTFDASSFKQYFINFRGQGVAFRVKFPHTYSSGDPAKKYPALLFLHGGGEVGCPTNGGIYNNERPIWLGGALFRDKVDNGQFDGFLVYPQYVISDGCFAGWLTAPSTYFDAICTFLDSLAKYTRLDIDRVTANGLSGGGYGCFRMAAGWPKYLAKIMPTSTWGPTTGRANFVHIPIWFATGGQDPEPSPEQAQQCLKAMKDIGADIRYTLFPDLGHNCWYQHWALPDYIPELNASHKANPLVFFQHNEFCDPTDVNAKLGLTPGFYAYEWQKDNALIASSQLQSGAQQTTFLDPASIISFTGNEITVKDFGTYRVRFKRNAGSDWSAWSPKPAVIKSKSATQTAAIQVDGPHSKVLPALDGSTTVPLTLPEGYLNYQWFKTDDNSEVDTLRTYSAPIGTYKARYNEEFGCSTNFSPDFTVVDANGTPKPNPATNLTSIPASQTVVKLTWSQDAGGASDAESGFEVYRATTAGGPYTFVRLLGPAVTTFNDTGLVTNKTYYYRVRAITATGAATPSNEAAVKTVTDKTPPTAPSNLTATVNSKTQVTLKWNAATDNIGVVRYDVYVNGVKLYTTPSLSFVATQLDSSAFYTFTIRAADLADNVSPPSNQVSINTVGKTPGYTPGVPNSFAATAVNYTKIALSWADTLAHETGYEIVRSVTEGGTYVPVATLDSNVTSYVDSGLAASQTFYYKIRAISAAAGSAFSSSVSAMTGALPETPVPPTELTGSVSPSNYVALNWSDNSDNEKSFDLYRSTDNSTFTLLTSLPTNSNAYTDTTASGQTVFYYYVVAVNDAGNSEHSDTVLIKAGNNAPTINGLTDIFVRSGQSASLDFTTSDVDGDSVTVFLYNKPGFVTVLHPSAGKYTIKAAPTSDYAGVYALRFTAVDVYGKSTTNTMTITVGDKNARSVFINFGSASKSASSPWNNWTGVRAAGEQLTNPNDETGQASTFTVTTVDAWAALTDLGHITGNNTGVFPDDVLRSGLVDSGASKTIRVSGLNKDLQYNLVFAGSQNEGISASSVYSSQGETTQLNARYNTNGTANLNNLVPDADGVIDVTISRAPGAATSYLNAMVIEELAATPPMLSPGHLYAEALNKTTVNLTWNDRTNLEDATEGYLLVRATDSVFRSNVKTIALPANTVAYSDTSLTANTKYWYRVRTIHGTDSSDYSNRYRVITPGMIVYVNFNTTIAAAPAPWNSLTAPPLSTFTTDFLKNELNVKTAITMTLTKEFNGEFTAGVNTGNNSGMVPDNALRADYWLDKKQKSQFVVKGLNHGKRYDFGFWGSSSTPDWFKGNYTSTFTVDDRTVYLNSWLNSSKVVFVNGVSPDENGEVALNFSTTPEAGYGFNGGVIMHEYNDTAEAFIPDPIDTTIVDTIPGVPVDPTGPDTTITDTTGPVTTPVDSIFAFKVYPNPTIESFTVSFINPDASNKVAIEIFDPKGVLNFRRDYGQLPKGPNTLRLTPYETNIKTGLYIVTLKMGGKLIKSVKLVRIRNH